MLQSVTISRRQSAIRKELAVLVGKEKLGDDETRSMESLDSEYQSNETKFRAALIVEDTERREAKDDLETRSEKDYASLVQKFELRQVALHLDEGRALEGATAEIVQEMRAKGGYRGTPVPWAALEKRSGETIASGVPDPLTIAPIIDRIFPDSAAVAMGTQIVNIDNGGLEYPVTTSAVTAGWATTETGAVASPTAYATTNQPLNPNQTLGVQMVLTRKSMKQSGDALEAAVRRDMNGAMAQLLDQAVFLGSGGSGQPSGVLIGSYGITSTSVAAAVTWPVFRAAIKRFLIANSANGPGACKVLIRPEVYDTLDGTLFTSTAVSHWDKMVANIGADNVVMSSNALAAPTGSPLASTALLTTAKNGVSPIFMGLWGGVDLIRDPYSGAASGELKLTALVTADVTVSRAAQLQILTGLQ